MGTEECGIAFSKPFMYREGMPTHLTHKLSTLFPVVEINIVMRGLAVRASDLIRDMRARSVSINGL